MLVCIRYLEQFLAYSQHSVNVHYYYSPGKEEMELGYDKAEVLDLLMTASRLTFLINSPPHLCVFTLKIINFFC